MSLKKYFPENQLNKAEKLIREFHGRMLLDSAIKNTEAVVLSAYMVSNEKKEGLVNKSEVKKLFLSFGKSSDNFDKALYEVSGKRKGKKKLIDYEKDKVGLNFNGIEKIKKILENKNE